MDLKDILSISGKPGLYQNIAQSKNGVIVESLTDGKRFQVFTNDKVSSLAEISIYTATEDMSLREVFRLIREKINEQPAPSGKSGDEELVNFFGGIIPDYDRERFYVSHMRKVVTWYNMLIQKGITDFSEPAADETAETAVPADDSPAGEEKQ